MVLLEVYLKGTSFVLPIVLCKSHLKLACYQKRLSISLCISTISVSPKKVFPITATINAKLISFISLCSIYDLGFNDLITLPYLVNNTHQATYIVNLGASSQFIDLDFVLNLNLKLDLKPEPQDLVLANRLRSNIGQIIYTCTLKLIIDQLSEDLTFHITKLASWNLIVRKP